MRNLEDCTAEFHGVNVALLRKSAAEWLVAFDAAEPLPPLPRIEMVIEAEGVRQNRGI